MGSGPRGVSLPSARRTDGGIWERTRPCPRGPGRRRPRSACRRGSSEHRSRATAPFLHPDGGFLLGPPQGRGGQLRRVFSSSFQGR